MNIVLVDDDALVCASLKTILEAGGEVRVAATGGSGAEAVALYRAHRPDVLLMDIRMAGMTGLEAGESLLREFPDARILFLTTFSDDEYIVRALRMGAKGYLIKQDFESILPALRAVHAGQSVFGGEDGTASGADAERGRIRLRSSGAERAGAGRHRAGGQGVQQQGDCRRAVPQRGNGAQLSQRDPRQARTAGSHPAGGVLLPPPGRVRA